MKFGKHYDIKKIKTDDLVALANEIGLHYTTILSHYEELREKITKGFNILRNDPALAGFEKTLENIEKATKK